MMTRVIVSLAAVAAASKVPVLVKYKGATDCAAGKEEKTPVPAPQDGCIKDKPTTGKSVKIQCDSDTLKYVEYPDATCAGTAGTQKALAGTTDTIFANAGACKADGQDSSKLECRAPPKKKASTAARGVAAVTAFVLPAAAFILA